MWTWFSRGSLMVAFAACVLLGAALPCQAATANSPAVAAHAAAVPPCHGDSGSRAPTTCPSWCRVLTPDLPDPPAPVLVGAAELWVQVPPPLQSLAGPPDAPPPRAMMG